MIQNLLSVEPPKKMTPTSLSGQFDDSKTRTQRRGIQPSFGNLTFDESHDVSSKDSLLWLAVTWHCTFSESVISPGKMVMCLKSLVTYPNNTAMYCYSGENSDDSPSNFSDESDYWTIEPAKSCLGLWGWQLFGGFRWCILNHSWHEISWFLWL